MIDPIADMLTRIRNAQAVGHKTVDFPYSKIKFELANILNREGYLGSIKDTEKGIRHKTEIILKYKDNKNTIPVINELIRISKPGQRIYVEKKELNGVAKGRGIVILTTSAGLMTNKEARKKGIGGEVICHIW